MDGRGLFRNGAQCSEIGMMKTIAKETTFANGVEDSQERMVSQKLEEEEREGFTVSNDADIRLILRKDLWT